MPTIKELDAALVAIDEANARAAIPPPPTAEVIAAENATLAHYRALKNANPFAANAFCSSPTNRGQIYRAMSRNPDEFTPQRAVSPRRI
jgi:hypothetical protein